MPLRVGGRRRSSSSSEGSSAAAEMLYQKLVDLVGPLDALERIEFASAIGDGKPFDELPEFMTELLEELATWATRRLVR